LEGLTRAVWLPAASEQEKKSGPQKNVDRSILAIPQALLVAERKSV
jgi:hypothetical protein